MQPLGSLVSGFVARAVKATEGECGLDDCGGLGKMLIHSSRADDGALGIGQSCGFSFSHCSFTRPLNHLNNSQHFRLKESVFVFTNF